jgi:hypothetical protein
MEPLKVLPHFANLRPADFRAKAFFSIGLPAHCLVYAKRHAQALIVGCADLGGVRRVEVLTSSSTVGVTALRPVLAGMDLAGFEKLLKIAGADS